MKKPKLTSLEKAYERARPWGHSKLLNETAKMLQKAIRAEAADENGNCRCVTCGNVMKWNENGCNAGHYVPGRSGAIVFEETNIAIQDYRCNCILGGNQAAYTDYMLRTHGQEEIDRLLQLKHTTKHWTREELVDMRESYRERLKAAKQAKGLT